MSKLLKYHILVFLSQSNLQISGLSQLIMDENKFLQAAPPDGQISQRPVQQPISPNQTNRVFMT